MLALVGCQGSGSPSKPAQAHETGPAGSAQAAPDMIDTKCPVQKFAESTPLPEASGAAWLTIDGAFELVVIADSGNHGKYALIDPDTGDTKEQGMLPLGDSKAGDDLEGIAAHGDKLYGLTSDGWMRVWQRSGTAFTLVDGPYAIGTDTKLNYEGLALAATPKGCAGFACSKGDGSLYCLTEQAGRYAVDATRTIAVTRKGALGDCAFDDTDVLWVGGNLFGLNRVVRVDGWSDPATAHPVTTNAFGVGNSEVIAVRGGVIYRMSDNNGAPSLMAKFRCSANAR